MLANTILTKAFQCYADLVQRAFAKCAFIGIEQKSGQFIRLEILAN